MKICGVVVWYNPTEKEVQNIYSYIKGIDKLYIVDNSLRNNQEIVNTIQYNTIYP